MEENMERKNEKVICSKCKNDTWKVYIRMIIDDARLYCACCGQEF